MLLTRLSLCLGSALAALAFAGCRPKTDPVQGLGPPLGPAPAWHLQDPDGHPVNSDQFKGKVVVFDFWATWCPPCRAEIPGYVDLEKKYGKDGLVIIGAAVQEPGPAAVKEFVAKNGINYPIVMADDTVVQAFGGIDAVPTTFLIDRSGIIRDKKVGSVPEDIYEKRILEVMKGSIPDQAVTNAGFGVKVSGSVVKN